MPTETIIQRCITGLSVNKTLRTESGMNELKNILISTIVLLLGSCCEQTKERVFLDQYEFEDFSQFKYVNVFKRGGDKNEQILAMFVSYLVNDISRTGCYLITLDKKNHQVIKAKWTTEYNVETDTAKLQQLAQTFMKYKIPRLNVDKAGNVFVYLANVETLAFVRFINESELQKRSKETKWIKVKNNWYKPK